MPRAAEPPAGGGLNAGAGRMNKLREAAMATRCARHRLRACAVAAPPWVGGAMRANGAPTRPQAISGGMGAGAPHESARRWRPQRRWLRRPQAQRSGCR